MSAFLKTLFGDANTVFAVSMVMLAEVLLAHAPSAVAAVPVVVLAGVAWLATRRAEPCRS